MSRNRALRKVTALLIASLILPLCLLLQQVPGLFVIGGIKPILIIPAVVVYSSLSRFSVFSASISFLCGLGWDILVGRSFGYFGVFLFVVAIIAHHYHNEKPIMVGSFMLEVTAVSALLCILDLFFYGFMIGYSTITETFTEYTLPTILYTGLFSPTVYAVLRLTFKLGGERVVKNEI